VGLVAYEMAVLVRRSNEHLGVGPRPGGYPQGHSGPRPAATADGNAPAPHTMPPGPGASPPYRPGGRTVPPSMSGTAPMSAMGPSSVPLTPLSPQPRDVPSAASGYSPTPMPAGQPGPASYPG
jgi:hypothetical protein